MDKEPRTLWKAHITPDGELWTEGVWISTSQEVGQKLEDDDEFEFWAELRNDSFTVPEMKWGGVYKFRSELNGIFSIYPIKEKNDGSGDNIKQS